MRTHTIHKQCKHLDTAPRTRTMRTLCLHSVAVYLEGGGQWEASRRCQCRDQG